MPTFSGLLKYCPTIKRSAAWKRLETAAVNESEWFCLEGFVLIRLSVCSVLDLNAFERQNKAEGLGMVSEEGTSEYGGDPPLRHAHTHMHTPHTHMLPGVRAARWFCILRSCMCSVWAVCAGSSILTVLSDTDSHGGGSGLTPSLCSSLPPHRSHFPFDPFIPRPSYLCCSRGSQIQNAVNSVLFLFLSLLSVLCLSFLDPNLLTRLLFAVELNMHFISHSRTPWKQTPPSSSYCEGKKPLWGLILILECMITDLL